MAEPLKHRYLRETAYDILGVSTTATAVELRDKFADQEREIRESGLPPSERAKRGERVKLAYDQISTGGQRVRIDFFLVDSRLGQMQAQSVANTIPKPELSVDDVFKARKIRVTHEALWEDLEQLRAEPPRVEGINLRPMNVEVEYELPPPLAIAFDC